MPEFEVLLVLQFIKCGRQYKTRSGGWENERVQKWHVVVKRNGARFLAGQSHDDEGDARAEADIAAAVFGVDLCEVKA